MTCATRITSVEDFKTTMPGADPLIPDRSMVSVTRIGMKPPTETDSGP